MNESQTAHCRLCAVSYSYSRLVNLKTDEGRSRKILNKLYCLGLKVNNLSVKEDTLPKTACVQCLDWLDKASDFVSDIEMAQSELNVIALAQSLDGDAKRFSLVISDSQTIHCRLCAELKPYNQLVNLESDTDRRRKILEQLTRVNIVVAYLDFDENSQLKTVCFPCLESLDKAFGFVSYVETAQEQLRVLTLTPNADKQLTQDNGDFESIHNEKYAIELADCGPVNLNANVECEVTSADVHLQSVAGEGNLEIQYASNEILPGSNEIEIINSDGNEFKIPSSTLKNEKEKETKEYQCSICKQNFVKRKDLIHHRRTHKEPKPYICDQCGKSFKLKSLLNYHMGIHATVCNWVCSFCSKAFKTKRSLSAHIRKKHTNENPYSCQHCKKNCSKWSELIGHVQVQHGYDLLKV